ncbi:helix-turn-helix domain-containing protein [Halomonas mongoliensis]|uniref:helix-turn-helix domain-containing protein n=1 Tax=Halomonas mongoliensis TaxID=321265 RepID=UPI00403AF93D
MQRARELPENRRDSVEQVTLSVGYEDTSAFRKMFIKHTGLSPGQHRALFGIPASENGLPPFDR